MSDWSGPTGGRHGHDTVDQERAHGVRVSVGSKTALGQPMTATQDEVIVDLQRANAALRRQLGERDAENRALIARQAASSEVLKTISTSPADTRPVFELIARRTRELCNATRASVTECDGALIHMRARDGYDSTTAQFGDHSWPQAPNASNIHGRVVQSGAVIHVRDLTSDIAYGEDSREVMRRLGSRSLLGVPLLRERLAVGSIVLGRPEVGGFDDAEITLVQSFAEQAVIAIASARALGELRARTEELAQRNSQYGERIEQQSATIDVLKAMSASPGNAQPVFDLIVRRAHELCNAPASALLEFDGEYVHVRSVAGLEKVSQRSVIDEYLRLFPMVPTRGSINCRAILDAKIVYVRDLRAEPGVMDAVRDLGHASQISFPLLRDGAAIGALSLSSWEVSGFSDSQVELLQTFAEQAVIAIGSAETFRELQARTSALATRNSEFGERIEQQSATIDVLKVMSASPDDAGPVFDLIVERASTLCEADIATVALLDGDMLHLQTHSGLAAESARDYDAQFPRPVSLATMFGRAILARDAVQISDVWADPEFFGTTKIWGAEARSIVAVPLLRAAAPIGAIALGRRVPGEFSATQMELLKTFAEQAVIAITSVASFRALRERTAELTRSVAELQALEEVLRAVNSSLDLDTLLATIVGRAVQLSQADEGTIYEFDDAEEIFVPKATFGMTTERVEALRDRRFRIGETPLGQSAAMRAPLHIPDLTQVPDDAGAPELVKAGIHALLAVPLLREDRIVGGLVIRRRAAGGFAATIPTLLQTFAGQAVLAIENARLFQELATRGEEARRARVAAETTLTDLRRTQDRLVQTEKMASLGQLTAGIAHEIKNPLNFVNNFSDLSIELLNELNDAMAPDKLAVADSLRTEIDDITTTLKGNLEKIAEHGRRADSIVKNMLLHSRTGPSESRTIDLNTTVEEALDLAYHGARAETPGFNITMEKELDPKAGAIDAFPQEFLRVMLNLINNGFYAARNRAALATDPDFEPTIRLTTRDMGERVEIRVRDNGTGIPARCGTKSSSRSSRPSRRVRAPALACRSATTSLSNSTAGG